MKKAEREKIKKDLHENIENILAHKEIIQKEIQNIRGMRDGIYADEINNIVKTYGLSCSLACLIFFPDHYEMVALSKMHRKEAV